jgi:hypothetical protein
MHTVTRVVGVFVRFSCAASYGVPKVSNLLNELAVTVHDFGYSQRNRLT